MQEIFICMDDSGKLSKKESLCAYGGLVFNSNAEKQEFSNKYRAILLSIKCKYCKNDKTNCTNKCPEIKSKDITKKHRRQLINLCKQFKAFTIVIENKKIYDHIMESKASKGRYLDYTQKLSFKEILEKLIEMGLINPSLPLKFIINIDQQTTKSNGYYSLRDGLYEELIHGLSNYNYGFSKKPILYNKLDLSVNYVDSKNSITIQAADIIAGTSRSIALSNYDIKEREERLKTFNWFIRMFP